MVKSIGLLDCHLDNEQKMSFDCWALQYTRKYLSGYLREYDSLFIYLISKWCDQCSTHYISWKCVNKNAFLENSHTIFDIRRKQLIELTFYTSLLFNNPTGLREQNIDTRANSSGLQ